MTSLFTRITPPVLFRFLVVALGGATVVPVLGTPKLGGTMMGVIFLAVVAFLAERNPLELPGYGIVSGLEATVIAALCLGSPVGAVLVLVAGVFSRALRRGKACRWDFSLYTFFQLGLCFLAPLGLGLALGGTGLLLLVLAGVAALILDPLCAAFHLYLLQDRIGRPSTRVEWARLRLSLVALLPLGVLLGSCLQRGPVVTMLLFIPLVVVFKGIQVYVNTLREAREVVTSLVEAVERREVGSAGHSERVAAIAGDIAREMLLRETTVRRIVTAARLHDLGKIGIEETILNKTESLSELEIASLRRHPEVGARVAAHLSLGKQEAEFIHYHHERFDGGGYPRGLRGHDIPQGARILAVAEAYDCMVSSERGLGKLAPGVALDELELAQGSQFDPSVVAAFKSVMQKKRVGFAAA